MGRCYLKYRPAGTQVAGKLLDCRRLACRAGDLLFFKACGLIDARRIESSKGAASKPKLALRLEHIASRTAGRSFEVQDGA
ncbi:MAG: hypothetical protein LHW51_04910 [Candidatus Cloacimonetes bacterium]|nr:hypothetical protein [Candidatus Cloacimonadota bacterium]